MARSGAIRSPISSQSHLEQRYGKKFLDADLYIQDWGVTYQESPARWLRWALPRFTSLLVVLAAALSLAAAINLLLPKYSDSSRMYLS
jgi:hypothetical protein